jgi:hypothetical protein
LEAEWKAEATMEARTDDILRALRVRFGHVPSHLEAALRAVRLKERADALFDSALRCSHLHAFGQHMRS